MVQPADPTIGDRDDCFVPAVAVTHQAIAQLFRAWFVSCQTMGRFDQDQSQAAIARTDKTGLNLALAAAAIARRQTAISAELLAFGKATKIADLGPQGGRRDQTDSFLLPQLYGDQVGGRRLGQAEFNFLDLGVDLDECFEFPLDDPAALFPQFGESPLLDWST